MYTFINFHQLDGHYLPIKISCTVYDRLIQAERDAAIREAAGYSEAQSNTVL